VQEQELEQAGGQSSTSRNGSNYASRCQLSAGVSSSSSSLHALRKSDNTARQKGSTITTGNTLTSSSAYLCVSWHLHIDSRQAAWFELQLMHVSVNDARSSLVYNMTTLLSDQAPNTAWRG
jgi:hypothetical protein